MAICPIQEPIAKICPTKANMISSSKEIWMVTGKCGSEKVCSDQLKTDPSCRVISRDIFSFSGAIKEQKDVGLIVSQFLQYHGIPYQLN